MKMKKHFLFFTIVFLFKFKKLRYSTDTADCNLCPSVPETYLYYKIVLKFYYKIKQPASPPPTLLKPLFEVTETIIYLTCHATYLREISVASLK